MKYFFKNNLSLGILFFLSILIHWQWINIISLISQGDWMYFNDYVLREIRFFQFNTWLEDLNGGRAVFDLVQSPFWAMFGVFKVLFGFNFNVSNHLLVLYPVILIAPISIYVLLRYLYNNKIGVILGSLLWWFILSSITAYLLKKMISPKALRWINHISGIILLSFGIAAIISTS